MTLIDSNVKINWTGNKNDSGRYYVQIPFPDGRSMDFDLTEIDMMAIIHVFSHIMYKKIQFVEKEKEKEIRKKLKTKKKVVKK